MPERRTAASTSTERSANPSLERSASQISTSRRAFHQPENNTPCPGDVNGDGLVSTTDILDVLGFYGCLSDCGDYDTNGDGVVGAPDLLFILGYYGQICD